MALDTVQLIKFCYHLRKADVEDKYSYEFLNGNIRPNVLVDMICCNKWDAAANQMKPNMQFTMHIGQTSSILVYEPSGGPPKIGKNVETNEMSKLSFILEEGGFVISNGSFCLAS